MNEEMFVKFEEEINSMYETYCVYVDSHFNTHYRKGTYDSCKRFFNAVSKEYSDFERWIAGLGDALRLIGIIDDELTSFMSKRLEDAWKYKESVIE